MRRSTVAFVCSFGVFGCRSGESAQRPDGGAHSPADYLDVPASCALTCSSEASACEPRGYECPALGAWDAMAHAGSCGDGRGSVAPVAGRCVASLPTGDAVKRTGGDPADPMTTILPTGQRAKPIGKVSVFSDFKAQFPTNVIPVPGSELVVVVDGGIGVQSVRLVDTNQIGAGGAGDPVVGREKFVGTAGVNYGAAIVVGTPTRLYVSGSAGSIVYAFTVDVAGKKLARDTANDVVVPRPSDKPKGGGLDGGYLVSGLAATPNGKRLVVGTGNAPSASTPLLVVDVDPGSASYKKVVKTIDLPGREIFTVAFHPSDAEGRWAWVSIWDGSRIDVVDLVTGAVRSIRVGKNPEAFVPLGTRWLAVVASDADEVSILDTLPSGGGEVLKVQLGSLLGGTNARGFSPSGLGWDPDAKRLYVLLPGINAVGAFDVTMVGDAPPTVVPSGLFGTEWWPTAIALRATDRSLVVVNGKGRGTGANPIPFRAGDGDITERMAGSIQLVAPPDAATLTAGRVAVAAQADVAKLGGASQVDCAGAPDDFPIPSTVTDGPSRVIKHVVFVVKENKTFDGVFGDLAGVDGDATLVMAPGQMDRIFGNQRRIARQFTVFDNYYTSAEQSIQGHVWTAFGRTTDFIERTWLVTWGRGYRSPPPQGIKTVGRPVEGSVFDWLQREGVLFDDMGEPVGAADDDHKTNNFGLDALYPGLLYAMDEPDTRKSCYMVARARATCDLKPFTYAVQPNDHTAGGAAGHPTPAVYIAVGDEAIGILLEGLSKSPVWGETLLIVTEDDPQNGGDHVDAHRTPLFMASPWIKRGYVSKGHYDTSSLHKLLAHVYGKPYPNDAVARASLPFDAFTSTPDFTPYAHLPRSIPVECNPAGTPAATTAAFSGWDLSRPDEAPGLQKQVWEMLHGGVAAPAGLDRDD